MRGAPNSGESPRLGPDPGEITAVRAFVANPPAGGSIERVKDAHPGIEQDRDSPCGEAPVMLRVGTVDALDESAVPREQVFPV
jgi:hypothetical protein